MKCAKCRSEANGAKVCHWGTEYSFCDLCTKILETFPNHSAALDTYLSPEDKQSQVNRNIWEARRQRATGESWWHKNNGKFGPQNVPLPESK